jgi:hypothetical protein
MYARDVDGRGVGERMSRDILSRNMCEKAREKSVFLTVAYRILIQLGPGANQIKSKYFYYPPTYNLKTQC